MPFKQGAASIFCFLAAAKAKIQKSCQELQQPQPSGLVIFLSTYVLLQACTQGLVQDTEDDGIVNSAVDKEDYDGDCPC